MPLLHRLANSFADRYADRICDHVRELTAAIPRTNVGENEMRRDYEQWARTAKLNVPYYTEDSMFFWAAIDGNDNNLKLACLDRYVFTRRSSLGLHTASGGYSWDLYYRAGARGLFTTEPPRPAKPAMGGPGFVLEADLRDAAHPERWSITEY